jgi:hypothetical protein
MRERERETKEGFVRPMKIKVYSTAVNLLEG